MYKGYQRAYTANLAKLAEPLYAKEFREMIKEADETEAPWVSKVASFLSNLRGLDATSSLNAAKVFKICPTPYMSPTTAMMDMIT